MHASFIMADMSEWHRERERDAMQSGFINQTVLCGTNTDCTKNIHFFQDFKG